MCDTGLPAVSQLTQNAPVIVPVINVFVSLLLPQVKDRLRAMLHSGQQSFTDARKYKGSSSAAATVEDKTQAETLIPATEPPLDSSRIGKTGSSMDPDIHSGLHDVPEGCALLPLFRFFLFNNTLPFIVDSTDLSVPHILYHLIS